MREDYTIAITNDIYTRKTSACHRGGARFARTHPGRKPAAALHRLSARTPPSILEAIDRMLGEFPNADIVFHRKRRHNLAATFQPRLSDSPSTSSTWPRAKNPAQGRPRHHQKRPVRHQQETDLSPTWAPNWM